MVISARSRSRPRRRRRRRTVNRLPELPARISARELPHLITDRMDGGKEREAFRRRRRRWLLAAACLSYSVAVLAVCPAVWGGNKVAPAGSIGPPSPRRTNSPYRITAHIPYRKCYDRSVPLPDPDADDTRNYLRSSLLNSYFSKGQLSLILDSCEIGRVDIAAGLLLSPLIACPYIPYLPTSFCR